MQWTHQRGASTLRDRKAAALHPPNLAFRPFAASPTAVFRRVSRRVGALRRPFSTPSRSPPPYAARRAQIRTLATSLKSAFVVPWRVGPKQHVGAAVSPSRLSTSTGAFQGGWRPSAAH